MLVSHEQRRRDLTQNEDNDNDDDDDSDTIYKDVSLHPAI